MRTVFLLFVMVTLAACSQQPAPKQLLPATVNQMKSDELKALYAECTKYGIVNDPRVIYSEQDCGHLQALINAASLSDGAKYSPNPVGQPILH
jgi:hypothetical protein